MYLVFRYPASSILPSYQASTFTNLQFSGLTPSSSHHPPCILLLTTLSKSVVFFLDTYVKLLKTGISAADAGRKTFQTQGACKKSNLNLKLFVLVEICRNCAQWLALVPEGRVVTHWSEDGLTKVCPLLVHHLKPRGLCTLAAMHCGSLGQTAEQLPCCWSLCLQNWILRWLCIPAADVWPSCCWSVTGMGGVPADQFGHQGVLFWKVSSTGVWFSFLLDFRVAHSSCWSKQRQRCSSCKYLCNAVTMERLLKVKFWWRQNAWSIPNPIVFFCCSRFLFKAFFVFPYEEVRFCFVPAMLS